MLVAVFDDESGAQKGSRTLQDLDSAGRIDVFSIDVIQRDEHGRLAAQGSAAPGALGRAVRRFTHSVSVAFGEPDMAETICGPETPAGRPYDVAHVGVGDDFLADVAWQLRFGASAVVAELWEQWVMPVNAHLEAIGVRAILRRPRENVAVRHIAREASALGTQLSDLEQRRARSSGADDRLGEKLRAVEEALRAAQVRATTALADARAEHEAKTAAVRKKLAAAQGTVKVCLQARLSERRAELRLHSREFRLFFRGPPAAGL